MLLRYIGPCTRPLSQGPGGTVSGSMALLELFSIVIMSDSSLPLANHLVNGGRCRGLSNRDRSSQSGIGNREWGSIRELNRYFFFSSFSLNKLIVVLYGTILDCLYYLLPTPHIESPQLEMY